MPGASRYFRGGAFAAAAPLRIPTRRANKIVLLDPAELLWFEAEETIDFGRRSDSHLLVELTLNELEARFGAAFFRAHRACLVNVSWIAEVAGRERRRSFPAGGRSSARPTVGRNRLAGEARPSYS